MMKKLLLVVGLVAILLFGVIAPAQASPMYGQRWTARNGWIVWADNDRYFPIRTNCHWWTGGTRWHISWRINPGGYRWAYSDAGNYGNRKPYNLSCSYRRTY